jgi:hypothetical protein
MSIHLISSNIFKNKGLDIYFEKVTLILNFFYLKL